MNPGRFRPSATCRKLPARQRAGPAATGSVQPDTAGQARSDPDPPGSSDEEFLAILPATGAEAARVLAERMRGAIEGCALAEQTELRATVGPGVAERAPAVARDERVKAADEALYRAKAQGRSCVFVATAGTEPEATSP